MAKIERFEELECWQEARALTKAVYQVAGTGPLAKDFRLRNQLTSAAVSVMTNIAEGFSRYHRRDFIRFLDIAQSSAAEVKSLLYVVLDQGYTSPERVENLQQRSETCQKMILGLVRHINCTLGDGQDAIREPAFTYDRSPEEPASYDLPEPFISEQSSDQP